MEKIIHLILPLKLPQGMVIRFTVSPDMIFWAKNVNVFVFVVAGGKADRKKSHDFFWELPRPHI